MRACCALVNITAACPVTAVAFVARAREASVRVRARSIRVAGVRACCALVNITAGRRSVGRCGTFVSSITAARVASLWSSHICTCGARAAISAVASIGVSACKRLTITRQTVATHVADLIACVTFPKNDAVSAIKLALLAVQVLVAYT